MISDDENHEILAQCHDNSREVSSVNNQGVTGHVQEDFLKNFW